MSEKKRQKLPQGLWVVATPIGNLDDLSPRARAALEEADAILCEDTRRGAQLLSALGIPRAEDPGRKGAGRALIRLDTHVSHGRRDVVERLVARLRDGESFALITDAGTPGVSDPGAILVAAARAAGVPVWPVPGPSAVAALLSVCGFDETAFAFRGFLPRKAKEIEEELALARASRAARVFIWFESPQRIAGSLGILAKAAPEAQVVAAKELTKLHERVFAGDAGSVARETEEEIAREGERGEWVFAARFPALEAESEAGGSEGKSSEWVKALQCLVDARVAASEAARRVSQHFGVSRNEAYERALRISGKKSEQGD